MTFEAHVPITELAHHGASLFTINALRRCDILLVDELRAVLDRHDHAVAIGVSTLAFLSCNLPGVGAVRLAAARAAFKAWEAAQPPTEETSNSLEGPSEKQSHRDR